MPIRQLVAAGTLIATTVSMMLVGIFALDGATAQAAPPGSLGTLTLTPPTGADTEAPVVRTSAGCSADSNGYNVVVTGPGAFAGGFFIVGTTSANFSTTEPITSAFSLNMRDAAAQLGTTIVPGEYVVTFNCVDDFIGDTKGTFVGSMFFTSPTAYQTTDPSGPPPTTTPAGPTSASSPSPTPTSSSFPSQTSASSPSSTTTTGATNTSSATATTTQPSCLEEIPTALPTDLPTDVSTIDLPPVSLCPPNGTIAADTNTPINAAGGNQAIAVTTGALGKTGGPTGIIFIGGLILIAAGLVLVIAVGRIRQDLK